MRYLFALQPEKLLSRSQANEVSPIPDIALVKMSTRKIFSYCMLLLLRKMKILSGSVDS